MIMLLVRMIYMDCIYIFWNTIYIYFERGLNGIVPLSEHRPDRRNKMMTELSSTYRDTARSIHGTLLCREHTGKIQENSHTAHPDKYLESNIHQYLKNQKGRSRTFYEDTKANPYFCNEGGNACPVQWEKQQLPSDRLDPQARGDNARPGAPEWKCLHVLQRRPWTQFCSGRARTPFWEPATSLGPPSRHQTFQVMCTLPEKKKNKGGVKGRGHTG